MLNFQDGRPIAIVKGGKYNNKILYVGEDRGSDNKIIENNPLDMLDDVYEMVNKNKLKKDEMIKIKNALARGDEENISSVYEIIGNVRNKSKELSKKEFKIFDDGVIQPLPRFDKTERCYVAGQTECGKTYYVKHYLNQLQKVFPKKKIFIFSDVESDPEIDDLKNLTRFTLDEELLEKEPIKPEIFKESICLFDDIDSIQNPKLLKYVQALRDSILRRGRHEDISCIVTSHLLTNYKDTRIILNECNNITIFCRSGSSYGIKYLLKHYIGLDKKQIQHILDLPSRWVTINKNSPQYVIYEKGVFIL